MIRSAPMSVALILTACAATGPPGAIASAPIAVEQVEVSAQREMPAFEIEGHYAVISIDGEAPRDHFPNTRPTVTIIPSRISFVSQCISGSWAWEGGGDVIKTSRWTYPESGAMVAMCARADTQEESAIRAAFTELDDLTISSNGDLVASGSGHVLELQRLAAPDVSLIGIWRVASLDGQSRADQYPFIMGGNDTQLYWEPSCARQFVEFTIGEGHWEARRNNSTGEVVCAIGLPRELADVWSALEAADRVHRAQDDGVLISGNGRSVLLVPHTKTQL